MSTKLTCRKIQESFFDEREDTVLAWLGMAGVLINSRGTILIIDPIITVVERDDSGEICEAGERLKISLPIESEHVPRVDAVLYTHADRDHFGRSTAEILNYRLAPKFLAPPPVKEALTDAGIAAERVMTAEDFMPTRIGNVEVVVTPALHDWQKNDPWKRGDCCGFLIRTPDGVIWHPGDTRWIDELLDVRGVDVFFFDVAAVNSHLGPEGSARLAKTCGAKVMIAYHYGTFDMPPGTYGGCDPEDSLPLVKDSKAPFMALDPGQTLRLPLESV